MATKLLSDEDQKEAIMLTLDAVRFSGQDIPNSLAGTGVDHLGALAVSFD